MYGVLYFTKSQNNRKYIKIYNKKQQNLPAGLLSGPGVLLRFCQVFIFLYSASIINS